MKRSVLLFALALSLAAIFIACGGSNSPSKPTPTGIQGTVTDIDTGKPVANAAVVIVDPKTMSTRSALVATNADGRFTVTGLAPGTYSVLVYHANLILFDRTGSYAQVEAGKMATLDMRLVDSQFLHATAPKISGVVLDADTGNPVPGAYVADFIWGIIDAGEVWIALTGITVPAWTVSDASGHFTLSPEVWTNENGDAFGLSPITASKAGYAPNSLVGDVEFLPGLPPALPMPAGGDSVLNVTIRLHVLPAGGLPAGQTGALKGRVIFAEEPVADLGVAAALAWTSHGDTLHTSRSPMVPVPGAIAKTDSEGRFVIANLTPGVYSLAGGYLPDDGFVSGGEAEELQVTAGDTIDVGDVRVLRALHAVTPAEGANITDTTPLFSWTAPQLASGYTLDHYEVGLSQHYVEEFATDVTGTSWQLPDSLAFGHGSHGRWWVDAYAVPAGTDTTVLIATFERISAFTVK